VRHCKNWDGLSDASFYVPRFGEMGAYTPVAMERVCKRLKTQRIEMCRCEKECARISKERR
jgi:hypothetical protein